ncbi:MAG: transposase, partial [Gammaproteobacteria bacterium]|nr:transposase [Gammaproteobacteria bacterium]
RPQYPTQIMLRVSILKHLNTLSNDQMEFMLNDRMSFQRFTKLTHSPIFLMPTLFRYLKSLLVSQQPKV